MKVIAVSMERWNGGIRAKRQYGSSTMTKFVCYYAGDEHNVDRWVYVTTGGTGPSDRKAKAIAEATGLLAKRYAALAPVNGG